MEGSARRGGVLLVSKPEGLTSHDVVEQIRRSRLAGDAKVGHAGTLDPFATGLLLVLIGQATRVQRFFMALPKTYRTRARFGVTSDSGDRTGKLTETGSRTDEATVRAALPRLTGTIRQRVPLTSAVKVGGERLYRKARRGEQFETPERDVNVASLELLRFDEEGQSGELELECSSGTYVRQLVSDLGDICGTGAYCEELERTAIGPFRLDQADEEQVVPLESALGFLPERRLDPDEARRARHGNAVAGTGDGATEGPIRLTADGELVAVAEPREGALRPVTVISA
jgi:tRNA pseudouridine55 synthase